MCSTTRAALLTGRNHHSVGVGCLANFDSRLSRLSRQDRARSRHACRDAAAARLPQLHGRQMARHAADRERRRPGRSTAGRWGAASTASTAFIDAETDQYAPELVRDNTPIDPPGTYADGYHLTADLVDQSIRFIADHIADRARSALADLACFRRLPRAASGARRYHPRLRRGVRARLGRRARARHGAAEGAGRSCRRTPKCPPRNDGVKAWDAHSADERRRVHAAAVGLCRHARSCRPASGAADRVPGNMQACATTR